MIRKFFELTTLPFLGLIKLWQKFIAPGLAPRCKYYPPCSTYAIRAIQKHGIFGIGLAIWRLVRCNPFSYGGVDHVPDQIFKKEIKQSIGAK